MLVTNVLRDTSTNYTLRLIPDMNFTCNGTIVGFTVAGRQRKGPWRSMNPIIQIWRPGNCSNIYNKISSDKFAIADLCTEPSIIFQRSNANDQVWKCNLSTTNLSQVPVQAGDTLGLLLPPRRNASFQLSIMGVSRGPINYVFEDQKVLAVDLRSVTGTSVRMNQELPQITVQVESGMRSYLLDFILSDFV